MLSPQALERRLSSLFVDRADIKRDFGAKGDGVDDTAAIEEAFATQSHIYFPPGVYVSTSAQTISNKNIVLEGVDQLSELRFTAASGNGIAIAQNDAFTTAVKRLLITTTQQEPGIGLSVDYSAIGGLDTHRHLQFLRISDLDIRGVNVLADGWLKGIFMDECQSSYLRNVQIAGRRDTAGSGASEFWPGMTHGIDNRSTLDLSPTNFTFDSIRIRSAGICFNNLGIMEGLRYHNCVGISSRDGILDDRREIVGADTVDPWLTAANCHFNTSGFGIRSVSSSQHFIHNNLLYEFQVDLGYTGISLETGNDPQIHSNHILGNSAAVNASVGIKVNNNNRAFIYANKLQRCDTPIEINDDAAGISGVRAWNNTALDDSNNEVQAVVYTGTASATSNTAVHYMGVIASGSNTGGATVISSATSIATFDIDDVPKGGLIAVTVNAKITKGGTAGDTSIRVVKDSGTGAATFLHDATDGGDDQPSQPAAGLWRPHFRTVFEKTTAGTLTMRIEGTSSGSSGTIADGDFQYFVERLR